MLAMDVNDDAGILDTRGAFEIIASMLAPTGEKVQKKTASFEAVFSFSRPADYSASLKVMKLARFWRSTRIDTERFFGNALAMSVNSLAEPIA